MFHYGDVVQVKAGFFKGCLGRVTDFTPGCKNFVEGKIAQTEPNYYNVQINTPDGGWKFIYEQEPNLEAKQ